jgi:hypothetical protein
MAITNYNANSKLNDFSNIFKAYTSGQKVNATGFNVDNSNNDLCNIFAPYVSGSKASNTGFKINNIDLSDIFQKKDKSWSILGTTGISGTRCDNITVDGSYVYIGGLFTSVNGVTVSNIARWNGTSWQGLSTLNNLCSDIYVVDSNTVYACGVFTSPANKIGRWTSGTNTWSTIGPGFGNNCNSIDLDQSGNIYAGGNFTRLSGGTFNTRNFISKYTTTWESIPTGAAVNKNGLNGQCFIVKYNSTDRNVYFGGEFTGLYNNSLTVTSCGFLAYWDGTNLSALGDGTNGNVYTIDISNNIMYIGGNFTKANSIDVSYVAQYNISTSTWSKLGNGLNGAVYKLKYYNNILYASGSFTKLGDNLTTANYIAAYINGEWTPIDNSITTSSTICYDIDIDTNGKIYVCGTFTTPSNYYGVYD